MSACSHPNKSRGVAKSRGVRDGERGNRRKTEKSVSLLGAEEEPTAEAVGKMQAIQPGGAWKIC